MGYNQRFYCCYVINMLWYYLDNVFLKNIKKEKIKKMKEIICKDGTRFIRVSRWISRKTDYNITEKHGLYCYGEVCEDGTMCVDYIIHKGYKIACGAMYGLESMFISDHNYEFIENGETHVISAVDMDGDIYNPYYIECDEWGDKFRLYKKVGWYNE